MYAADTINDVVKGEDQLGPPHQRPHEEGRFCPHNVYSSNEKRNHLEGICLTPFS